MSKLKLCVVACFSLGMNAVFADPIQNDCQDIQSGTGTTGACATIMAKINALQPYAPFKPFQDLTKDGSSLDGRFSWGPQMWASSGSGGGGSGGGTSGGSGGTDVLPADNSGSSGGSSDSGSQGSTTDTTFQ